MQTLRLKTISFVFVVLCMVLFSSPLSIQAQSNEIAGKDKFIKCLNARDGQEQTTSFAFSDDGGNKLGSKTRRFLTGTFSTDPETKVYPVACKKTATGRKCTTGNAEMDKLVLGGVDPKEDMSIGNLKVDFYKPEARSTELVTELTVGTDGVANVDAILDEIRDGDGAEAKAVRKGGFGGTIEFFGVEISPHVEVPPVAPEENAGKGALQQDTFLFDKEEALSNAKNCALVKWIWYDPYGVVFDSKSLEPLANVLVTIRDEAGVKIPNSLLLQNDSATPYEGIYNYLVQPGKYTLTFTPPPGYRLLDTSSANPNMNAVYDFIDENNVNGHCTIYKPGEIIDEKAGVPECRNIPMEPISVQPMVKDVVGLEYEYLPDSLPGYHVINGKVSHALATITAFQTLSSSQRFALASTEANHAGFYQLLIPVSKILPNSPIEVMFKKSPLMDGGTPQNSKNTLTLDPLPLYVEGYAFDEILQVIPHAQVQVRLKNGDSIYYQATTDENGYFFIPSSKLPSGKLSLEFYLVFVKANGKQVPYKLYEFTQANEYYFAKENINLLSGTKNGRAPLPQAAAKTKLELVPLTEQQKAEIKKKNMGSVQSQGGQSQTQEAAKKNNAQSQQIVLLIGGLIALVGVGAAGAILLIRKNKSTLS